MIHIVVGTKAQLIKMAPVMRELNKKGVEYRFISTGQHQETMSEIMNNFEIREPDITLYKGKDIVSVLSMLVWAARLSVISVFRKRQVFGREFSKKDIVLVHGDTFSTLVGAFMARLAGLKVGHVESGLRSFRWFHPFPEELTRILTFKLSQYYFCPDERAMENLKGQKGKKINTGGNTLYDALESAGGKGDNAVVFPSEEYAIATLHRFENISSHGAVKRLVEIIELAAKRKLVLFVTHKPTINALRKYDLHDRLERNKNVVLVPRMDYFSFVALLRGSQFVISDGGSNQEECFYLGKPIILIRDASERHEGVGENCVISHYDKRVILQFLDNYSSYKRELGIQENNPSEIIADFLKRQKDGLAFR